MIKIERLGDNGWEDTQWKNFNEIEEYVNMNGKIREDWLHRFLIIKYENNFELYRYKLEST